MNTDPSTNKGRKGYNFGTFQGVFTPSVLTIVGVIMYLRSGWVLGNLGLGGTLLIITVSTAITLLAGLSLSALATNMKVKIGGAYYIISRSLGVEAGAAIGVPLFLAQAISVSFYVVGFSEALTQSWPDGWPVFSVQELSIVTLLILTVLALFSADWALKLQYVIMAVIGMSLVSFFTGGAPATALPADTPIPPRMSFWPVFAVYFPAVTGILAGVSMSGDLRNPARSIPRGTIAAILSSYVLYMIIPVFLNSVIKDKNVLLVNNLIMRDVARWGMLIVAGVSAASLSSALGSMLGAPRTLQALARDRVVPRFLGKGYGPQNEPRVATALCFLLALGGVLLGDLNMIAPILTMFFLTTYGVLCLSAGMEELIGSPSWRPAFRVRAHFSLAGFLFCVVAMFMIDAGSTFISGIVVFGIYYVMQRRNLKVQWGDMRSGILMLLARFSIRHLMRHKPTERGWTPNILVLSGTPTARWYLIELADAMAQNYGCLTVASVAPLASWSATRVRSMEQSISNYLQERDVFALVKVLVADDVLSGAEALIKAYGFGPITPNTIMLGETEVEANYPAFARLIRLAHRTHHNLVMVRESETDRPGASRRLDVWWRGEPANVGLMMVLAYLLNRAPDWKEADICLKTVVESAGEIETTRQRVDEFIATQRLNASADVIERKDRSIFEVIRESSHDAGLVFLGMRPPADEETDDAYSSYYAQLIRNTDDLPPVALVLSAEPIEFKKVFDQGPGSI